MPKYSCSCITIPYMIQVRKAKYYVPRYTSLRPLPCVNPPSLFQIMIQLAEAANDKNIELGLTPTHLPDRRWALDTLATLNPRHVIFGKDYNNIKSKPKEDNAPKVDNEDDFFSGLVLSSKTKASSKKKRRAFKYFPQDNMPQRIKGKT